MLMWKVLHVGAGLTKDVGHMCMQWLHDVTALMVQSNVNLKRSLQSWLQE